MVQILYDVSIIIVNYNTCDVTSECIDSIYNYTKDITFEVIVIDNFSQDKSFSIFSQDKRIKYYYSSENLGFGRANNLGFEMSTGRNIMLLNSDTILLNNAIKILNDFLDSSDTVVGACGGNLFDEKFSPTYSYCRNFPSIFRDSFALISSQVEIIKYGRNRFFNYSDSPLEVKHITGADMMIKRSVIDRVGLFNPAFFLYYEETELCHRMHSLGYKLFSVPKAHIVHLCGKSVLKSKLLLFNLDSRQLYFNLVGKSYCYRYIDYIINRLLLYVRKLIRYNNKNKREIFNDCLINYKFKG